MSPQFAATTFIFSFAAGFILIVVYLSKVWTVERFLEKEFPDVYDKLGKPNLVKNNSFRTNRRFSSFIKKEYSDLESPTINSEVGFLRKAKVLIAVCFALMALSAIYTFSS